MQWLRARQASSERLKPSLLEAEHCELEELFGSVDVASVLAETEQLFMHMDVEEDGLLRLEGFQSALGLLGIKQSPLASFIFNAVDKDASGSISFAEFLRWVLTMRASESHNFDEKLRFGFNLIDLDKNGVLQKSELTTLVFHMFHTLTSLDLNGDQTAENQTKNQQSITRRVNSFVEELLTLFDGDNDGEISWDEYRDGCLRHPEFVQDLGLNKEKDESHSHVHETNGKNKEAKMQGLFFGTQGFDFMLSFMMGLELAVGQDGTPSSSVIDSDDDSEDINPKAKETPNDRSWVEIEALAAQEAVFMDLGTDDELKLSDEARYR
jgi:Ca2+-binding EF-hand superfamily protein